METDLQDYSIDLLTLQEGQTERQYRIGPKFFASHENDEVEEGQVDAWLRLDKSLAMIVAEFGLEGTVRLVCDRSLEPFDEPISVRKRLVFKFGERAEEIDEEISILPYGTETLDMGAYLYEFVLLAVPAKKLHPDLRSETDEDGTEGEMVYEDAPPEEEPEGEPNDPRFAALKKLREGEEGSAESEE